MILCYKNISLLILGIAWPRQATGEGYRAWPANFKRPTKKKDYMWFSDGSLLEDSKNQELAQIRLCPKIQFKFDLEKVVQNKTEQRTKFSSLQFWKVTFLSRDYSVSSVRAQAQPKANCLAKGYGSRWSVLTVLFLMNSRSGTSAWAQFFLEAPSPQIQCFQWRVQLQAAPWGMERASLEPSYTHEDISE